MQINLPKERLINELNLIYNAKKLFLEAQQHRVRQTRNEALMRMLVENISETRQQIRNLKLFFMLIGHEPQPIVSEVVTSLIAESQTRMQQTAINPEILEAVIVEAQIKMKNFEISFYRNLMEKFEQSEQVVIRNLVTENLRQDEQVLKQLEQYF